MPSPQRRRVLHLGLGATAATAGLATSGCGPTKAVDRALQWSSLPEARAEVLRLARAPQRKSAAHWDWAATLVHCAQSIEYSMTGYPQPKPALFRRTVGPAAFTVFSWRGRMSHDLAEPIPGAPALPRQGDAATALARLETAIDAFAGWSGPLQPHFAYGALTKQQYELAHAMHLANHLSEFDAPGAPAPRQA